MDDLLISVSGIRGIVGEALTPESAVRFATAFGLWTKGGRILVGRDSRTSSHMLSLAVQAGLASVSCYPVDIGLCPTPTVEVAVTEIGASGAVIVTASHNPPEWNGLKLIGSDGLFLDSEQGKEIEAIYHREKLQRRKWDEVGKITRRSDAIERHINRVMRLSVIEPDTIRKKRFTVVTDCCNGVGGLILPALLRNLGCRIVELNSSPTGIFSRLPEPVPENLDQLCKTVVAVKADVGFAVDPDVDRLALVTDKGEAPGEEYTLALATKQVLALKTGPVVTNLSTSRMVDDIAETTGVPVFRTPVGEINVAKEMIRVGAIIGGEGNGGVMLPELHAGRDAAVGAVLILQLLASENRPISSIIETIPKYYIVKQKYEASLLDKTRFLEAIREYFSHELTDTRDGLKIIRDKSWIHIRPSNTEPIIRIIAEAPDRALALEMCDEIRTTLIRADKRRKPCQTFHQIR